MRKGKDRVHRVREHSYRRTPARRMLVQWTIDTVVAVDRKMIGKVFHVLRWTSKELERAIAASQQVVHRSVPSHHQRHKDPVAW